MAGLASKFNAAGSYWTLCETLADIRRSRHCLVLRSAEFLGESDEKPFRPADVAEAICVLILDYFTDELRTALASVSSMSSMANMARR